jgi:hypothetical protein
MSSYLEHVAFNVKNIDWYSKLFQEVFGMDIKKTAGEKPDRKIWLRGGIQLIESDKDGEDGCFNHIAVVVNDIELYSNMLIEKGCRPSDRGKNWIELPNNILIELICE